jgi:hypothetical protein
MNSPGNGTGFSKHMETLLADVKRAQKKLEPLLDGNSYGEEAKEQLLQKFRQRADNLQSRRHLGAKLKDKKRRAEDIKESLSDADSVLLQDLGNRFDGVDRLISDRVWDQLVDSDGVTRDTLEKLADSDDNEVIQYGIEALDSDQLETVVDDVVKNLHQERSNGGEPGENSSRDAEMELGRIQKLHKAVNYTRERADELIREVNSAISEHDGLTEDEVPEDEEEPQPSPEQETEA